MPRRLTQGLLQEFEGAPAEQVRADVEEFLARLRELGAQLVE